MKKLLLTMIVTMLTFVGAWGQDISIELYKNDGTSIVTTELSPLVLDVRNTSGEKIWTKVSNSPGGANVTVEGNAFVGTSDFYWEGNWQISGTNGNFTVTPVSAGIGKVTLKIIVKEYPGGVETPVVKYSLDLWVKVIDPTKADVLTFADGTTAKNVDVAKGYPVSVPVMFEPETAVLNLDKPSENGINASYNSTTKAIEIDATEAAEVGNNATFTLSDGVKSITLTATVVVPTPVTAVTINPTEIKIARGETATFTATTDGDDKRVTWSVAGSAIELTADGTIRALSHGTGTITATSVEDETISASAIVKVTDKFPLGYSTPIAKMHIGEDLPTDFYVPEVEDALYTISYTSSKPSVLTVDEDGVLTGVSKGTAKLTVTVTPTIAGEAALWETSVFEFNVVVSQSEYSLTLAPAASAIDLAGVTETQTITLDPTVTLNGTASNSEPAYAIEYTLESPFEGVSVNKTTGVVSIATDAQYGIATIVATLVPLGSDANDYVGTTATATVTISKTGANAIIKKIGEDEFVLSIPSAGAFYSGGLSDNPTVTYVGFANNDDATTNIAAFKNATTISIEGIASNTDIQEFTHLVGGSGSTIRDLDMGGLVLTEAVTTTPDSHSFMSSGGDPNFPNSEFYNWKLINVINFVMPRPSLTAENGTKIPANFDYWFGKNTEPYINSLVITEGWTEVGESAFNRNKVEQGHPENSLESLKLPNTLKYIRKDAFAWLQCPTVVFPASIEVIEDGAFTASPAALKDVYFTGRIAPRIVEKNAFGASTQISNNAYNNPTDGTATRDNYKAQSGWECMLHYPAGLTAAEKATYEDPTRVYLIGERIATGTDPVHGWASNSNMYTVAPAWNNPNKKLTELDGAGSIRISSNESFEAGFRDLAVGTAYIWPSVTQFTAAFVIAQSGYHWDGTEMTNEEKDRMGLYSFVFCKGDATPQLNEEEWIFPYRYDQDLWWTLCVPFDMSVEKIKEVFGEDTQLCLFSKAIRDKETGKLRLEFKRSVMDDEWAKGDDIGAGLKAHTPYMIYPSGEYEHASLTLDGYRKVSGFEIKEGDAVGFNVVAEDEDGNSLEYEGHPWNYTFIGNYQENYYIPQYSYFLSYTKKNPTHRFFFEQGTTRSFNPYTCVVRAYRGAEDNEVFFNSQSTAPQFSSVFGIIDDDVTGVEDVEIVCGRQINNDKVYNINGQLMNSNVLAPGIYIKNGKKFIVK